MDNIYFKMLSFCIIYFFLSYAEKCQPFKRVECIGHREVAVIDKIKPKIWCMFFPSPSDSFVVVDERNLPFVGCPLGSPYFPPNLPVSK
jgi:hypothetical protein